MYITFITKDSNKQYTFEDLFNNPNLISTTPYHNAPYLNTFTYTVDPNSYNYNQLAQRPELIQMAKELKKLYSRWKDSFDTSNMRQYYDSFQIPKRSGGLRHIDAPKTNLMSCLTEFKNVLQYNLKMLPHNNAFAYVQTRSTYAAVQKHQKANSRWFLKIDIKDFFPSCDKQLIMNTFRNLYPTAILIEKDPEFHAALLHFVDLCLLDVGANGEQGLPQGTPASPLLTNLIMVAADEAIRKYCTNTPFKTRLTYTRYADDIILSAEYDFPWKDVQNDIQEILHNISPKFYIKHSKTRYGSSAGSNWNLGYMLNRHNNITLGYKEKRKFKSMVFSFLKDLTDGVAWNIIDVQTLQGRVEYHRQTEADFVRNTIDKYNKKFGKNLMREIREILRS